MHFYLWLFIMKLERERLKRNKWHLNFIKNLQSKGT